MREDEGNLWTYPADAVVITTNGYVKKNGEAVMGRGCAREAAQKFSKLPAILGADIKEFGNIVHCYAIGSKIIYTMPVKHNWYENADIELIRQSAQRLLELVEGYGDKTVVLPRPGCGNGGLDWKDVKPILEEILDDRFISLSYGIYK